MIEIDAELYSEAVIRLEARGFVAVAHFNVFQDTNEFFGRWLIFDTCRLQQKYERAGTAVHDRHLARGHIDVDVIDAESGERRHQMLDRRYAHAVSLKAR